MKCNVVVTIAREFGCGGRRIGQILANKLECKYYDRNLITMAAEMNGVSEEIYAKHDEKVSKFANSALTLPQNFGLFYAGMVGIYAINDDVFFTQSEIIKKAAQEACVIVGRCADYTLRDKNNVVSVFLYADMETRVGRVIDRYGSESVDKVSKMLKKLDKQRANYYDTYTGLHWGDNHNYDININTSKLTDEEVANVIYAYINARFK